MPTAFERLHQLTAKLDRAKHHLNDLEQLHKAYIYSRPIEVKEAEGNFYVESIKEPGADFANTIGDILQNLVSALDHLAYQLVCVGENSEGPFLYVYFPFSQSEELYQKRKVKVLKGARQVAIDAMDQIKPYKGGNEILWRLHQLNNIDKHRLLITVGGAFNTINLGTEMAIKMGQMLQSMVLSRQSGFMSLIMAGPVEERFMPKEKIHFPMGVKDKKFPLSVGTVLSYGVECNPEDFTFYLAFGEPGFDEGNPMIEILNQMTQQVEDIIFRFKPML